MGDISSLGVFKKLISNFFRQKTANNEERNRKKLLKGTNMQKLTMICNNPINSELSDGIGNFGFETIWTSFLQFGDLHHEWTNNLKVMLTVSEAIESCMFTEKSIFTYLIC